MGQILLTPILLTIAKPIMLTPMAAMPCHNMHSEFFYTNITYVDWLFILRLKHLAGLFSLNVFEQCWRVWHLLKCDLSHAYRHSRTKAILRNQARAGLGLARAWFKKERPRTKKALLKKMWNQNGCQLPRPPAFDRIKILIIMISLQNIVISGAQGLLMLMGSKILTRPQNVKMKEQCFAACL